MDVSGWETEGDFILRQAHTNTHTHTHTRTHTHLRSSFLPLAVQPGLEHDGKQRCAFETDDKAVMEQSSEASEETLPSAGPAPPNGPLTHLAPP